MSLKVNGKEINNPEVETCIRKVLLDSTIKDGNFSLDDFWVRLDWNWDGKVNDTDYFLRIKAGLADATSFPLSTFQTCASYVNRLIARAPRHGYVDHVDNYSLVNGPTFIIFFAERIEAPDDKKDRAEDIRNIKNGLPFPVRKIPSRKLLAKQVRAHRVEVTDLKNGFVRLRLADGGKITVDIPKSEITKRGFDLKATRQNTGKELSSSLRSYLWSFATGNGPFAR